MNKSIFFRILLQHNHYCKLSSSSFAGTNKPKIMLNECQFFTSIWILKKKGVFNITDFSILFFSKSSNGNLQIFSFIPIPNSFKLAHTKFQLIRSRSFRATHRKLWESGDVIWHFKIHLKLEAQKLGCV